MISAKELIWTWVLFICSTKSPTSGNIWKRSSNAFLKLLFPSSIWDKASNIVFEEKPNLNFPNTILTTYLPETASISPSNRLNFLNFLSWLPVPCSRAIVSNRSYTCSIDKGELSAPSRIVCSNSPKSPVC